MSPDIPKVRSATVDEWQAAWAGCDYATYFQGPEWAAVFDRYTGGELRPRPTRMEFADGKSAIIPLTIDANGCPSMSPAGTFGGWVSTDDLSKAQVAGIQAWLKRLPALMWRVNPYAPHSGIIDMKPADPEQTHAIDLREGAPAAMAKWSRGHLSALKKARSHGVTVRVADSLEDWRRYYDLYEDTLRRWGETARTKYPWALFEIIEGLKSDNVRLWLAEHDGAPIAGALCFYAPKHVVYWHGAALESQLDLRPMTLVIHDAFQDAAARGAHWFDLNPSGGLAGVRTFKERFGATALDAPMIHHMTPMTAAVRKAKSFYWRLRNKVGS